MPVFNRLAAAALLGSTRRLRFNPCDAELFFLVFFCLFVLSFRCCFFPERPKSISFPRFGAYFATHAKAFILTSRRETGAIPSQCFQLGPNKLE